MKLIVGLGNPGSKYAGTRHNIGRLLMESVARDFRLAFTSEKKLQADVASLTWEGSDVVLSYPRTYVNLSGETLKRLVAHYAVSETEDLLLVTDDLALPFGKLRLRGSGSPGGHNGLKSVEALLGTADYARLRVGIGEPMGIPTEDYVLEAFSPEEKKLLPEVLERAAQACALWIKGPLSSAMNVVNA